MRPSFVAIALIVDLVLLVGLYSLAPLVSPAWDGKVLCDDGLYYVAKVFFLASLGYKVLLGMRALEAATPLLLVVIAYWMLVPSIDYYWIARFAIFGLIILIICLIIAAKTHLTTLRKGKLQK